MPQFSNERISALIAGTKALRLYAFPGLPDVKIAMRLLTEAELDAIDVGVMADLEKLGKPRSWDVNVMVDAAGDLHQRLTERRIVFHATFTEESIDLPEPMRFFAKIEELGTLDTGTLTKLYTLYCEHQHFVNPLISLDDAGVEELAEALGKDRSAGAQLFSAYDRSTLERLLIAMVRRASTASATPKSSPG